MRFKIGERIISKNSPVYFVADLGANHDGNLTRAKDLICQAKMAGADCAKFQHFKASKIVSAVGFDGFKTAHQRGWDKSVFEMYEDASINPDWNEELAATCREVGIDFMTTPYDLETVDSIDHLVKAYKIGSGDITYLQLIERIARKSKPVFLATGASTMEEVERAVMQVLQNNIPLCLMQCNTNYTGDVENMRHVNLRVLEAYRLRWPALPLGLSDHTSSHVAVLGAVALGATVIEKHFTDHRWRNGPDHAFALEPHLWREMVEGVRELEKALGDGVKRVEDNEVESRIVQRRALRMKIDGWLGDRMEAWAMEALRPCPDGALTPAQVDEVVGKVLRWNKKAGLELYRNDFTE